MRANADAIPFADGLRREKRALAALPGTFVDVPERARITVKNQALAVLGVLRHRGAVDFVPETARYVRR